MTTITGSDTFFTNIDSSYTATKWEGDIDQAIDAINIHGRIYSIEIPNLSGTAGSKSVSVTSAEAGAIREVAAAVHAQNKQSGKQSSGLALGGINMNSSSGTGTATVDNLAKEMAENLRDLDITVGSDASF